MKLLSDLPNNARYAIMVEPLWAVFGGAVLFYAPLYMKELGLNEVQMGIVNTTNMLVNFIFFLLASSITNKLGRRRTTFIFDMISWGIPMIVWALAQNFWYFFIAGIINGVVKVVAVSWYCLIAEDAENNKRSKIFGAIYVINSATGLFTLLSGIFVNKYGVVDTLRILYIAGAVSMVSMFILRNYLVKETKPGIELMKKHSNLTLFQGLREYFLIIPLIGKRKNLIIMTIIFILTNINLSFNFYQVIFLNEKLGFGKDIVALTPGVTAVVNIIFYLFFIPRLNKYMEEKKLTAALIICSLGSLILILMPQKSIFFLVLTFGILAVGNLCANTYRDSVYMNNLGEHEKADLYSAVQTITSLACIPAGYLAGLAYSLNPAAPFIIVVVLFITSAFLSTLLDTKKSQKLEL
ncbi:MAG: MFS transporter [Bacillota bacterium]|nr:MFS transporter [Bacillota bacterium]